MDAVATSWPEVEDPTERMPIRWFEEIHNKPLESLRAEQPLESLRAEQPLESKWTEQERRLANGAELNR